MIQFIKQQQELGREAFGEVSAIFMSQECKGTEIVMPTEELTRIADTLIAQIINNVGAELVRRCEGEITDVGDDTRCATCKEHIASGDCQHPQANATINRTITIIKDVTGGETV